jgi:fluoride exporter
MLRELLFLALAGALGTLSRHGVTELSKHWFGEDFAWGTLAVNVLGCLLIGLIMQLAFGAEILPRALRLPLTIGFLGAFTTMSTFGYQTVRYLEEGAWLTAGANISANLVLCLIATFAGLAAGRALVGQI